MLKKLTIKTRLILVLVFLAAQLLLGALIGITNLGIANQSMHSLYNDRLVPLSQLDQMIRLLNTNQLNLSLALAAEPDAAATLMREVDTNAAAISALWSDYMASTLTAEEAKLAEQFASDRARLLETGIAPGGRGDPRRRPRARHGALQRSRQDRLRARPPRCRRPDRAAAGRRQGRFPGQ
ncbi:Tar ligand binding domain-containing protein [Massilia sp. B-10]|nr:Tar ligand binding domain-containing protein [Massilia sp. B-10]